MSELSVGLVGAAGRMGRALVRRIDACEGCRLVTAIERSGHAAIGQDTGSLAGIGERGVAIGEDAAAMFVASDVVIEFSSPAATAAHVALAAESGTAHVIGTTGLDDAETAALQVAAETACLVWAPNMSVGVNLLFALTRRAAAVLGDDYDIEIVEMHHRHKVDAPSGTALALGRAAALGRGADHDEVAARGRDGITGERERGDIGYAVLRGGNVVGEHSVVFAADDERIALSHIAGNRAIFARGAVAAALWAQGQPPGLYGMADVLGLGN